RRRGATPPPGAHRPPWPCYPPDWLRRLLAGLRPWRARAPVAAVSRPALIPPAADTASSGSIAQRHRTVKPRRRPRCGGLRLSAILFGRVLGGAVAPALRRIPVPGLHRQHRVQPHGHAGAVGARATAHDELGAHLVDSLGGHRR